MGEKATEEFTAVWSSAWEPIMEHHAITMIAVFDLSRDEDGDTAAQMVTSSWYDSRGLNGFKTMKDRPITRLRANEISWGSPDIVEMQAMEAALEAEW